VFASRIVFVILVHAAPPQALQIPNLFTVFIYIKRHKVEGRRVRIERKDRRESEIEKRERVVSDNEERE
jgi:hypothetical protein